MRSTALAILVLLSSCADVHEPPPCTSTWVHPPMNEDAGCRTSGCHHTGDAGVGVGFVPMPRCDQP